VTQEKALETAERLRKVIENAPLEFNGKLIPLTASIGLAFADADQTLEAVIHHADQALYRSKASGRNQVVEWKS